MEGELIPVPPEQEHESESKVEVRATSRKAAETPALGWFADFILTVGFACCAGVAFGWVDPPFSPAFRPPSVSAIESASSTGGATVSDSRLGVWTAPYSGTSSHGQWVRTAKVVSAGIHGVRLILTVDFIDPVSHEAVPGILGEYSTTILMQQDGRGASNEGGCHVDLEWSDPGNALQIRQRGPCGEPGNIAADGTFTASFAKQAQVPVAPPASTPGVTDCSKSRTPEDRLFCKDNPLRIARLTAAAVYADAVAQLRQTSPESVAEFEQNDKNWQAEVRRVCLAVEGSPDDLDAAKSACFSQSYDARVNWLRLHTGLIHLGNAAAKDETAAERYADALSEYADSYGVLALQLPSFERRLRPILPGKDMEQLSIAMTHRGPRTGLFQAGCGPQGCDHHEGAFELDSRTGSVALALRQGPRITVYSFEGQSAELPKHLHDWLEQRTASVSEIVYKP